MSDLMKSPGEDARDAELQSARYAVMLATFQLQQLQQQTPQTPGCACHQQHRHGAPVRGRSVGRTLAVAGGVAVCGCVLTGLFLAVALTAVAVGVSALVMLFLVREIRRGGSK